MSQMELAAKVGVTQGAVSMWENGITEPGFKHLRLLADILSVTIDELVNGELAS